jgi:predicted  nucleic acid-binding Zn-ribbon protein
VARKKKPSLYFYKAFWKPDRALMMQALDSAATTPDSAGPVLGFLGAWHKTAARYNPYGVACEFICGTLGKVIGLPIAPFAITVGPEGAPCFSSLDFNFNREKLPCVVPDKCVEFMPSLCAGLLVFDIFVANEDRHDANLLVDQVSRPKEMWVFDHDQALLAGCPPCGTDKLAKVANRLGITGGESGGNRHVFLDEVRDASLFADWIRRIEELPKWVISDACDQARRQLDLAAKDADAACEFLIDRRMRVGELIHDNRSEFKSITHWPEGLFK